MAELTFNNFRERARSNDLSPIQKIGFPDNYRQGYEQAIVDDIFSKTDLNDRSGQAVVDIGCGCSDLVRLVIDQCRKQKHHLTLNDSAEMLALIKDTSGTKQVPGRFPDILPQLQLGSFDVVICYSVIPCVFSELNYIDFIHKSISLLKPGGKMLVGDIPNVTKRQRFLNSEEGKDFLKNAPANTDKGSTWQSDDTLKMDDAVVFSILTRFRNYGCETYLLPQSKTLPLSNRREDILIVKR